MLSCGIPELSDLDDLKYVYDALRPHESEADATMYFTRLIESSLGSVATKLNFFIHNLAQMKFATSEDRPSLSFAPRVHTARSDGIIKNLYISKHIPTAHKGYAFVVKVEREGQQEVQLVQRTFEEFQELHSKLRLLFPSSKLPSFPSRFVIGRSRSEATAERRKDELNGYVWHLTHTAPEVAQCDLVYTFFHPLSRDERTAGNGSKPAEVLWSPAAGTELGEIKLSISYKNDKLFIMVIHIRGLQPLQEGTDPDPYVKLYLLPDPQKTSKRKTKAARRTCNPTYNEMLVYDRIPRGDLNQRVIHLRVLSDGAFWENTLLGETFISLTRLVPGQHWVDWHQLGRAGLDSTH
ncbi:Phosphatidylinositol 4-phosphate 3-kinase C2 domain-containing subunit beta [Ataeniobius toweri]|uniref:Phosphatidylinositol 4-phosphate 3-kinase C2 domain-containing subunit beta n=1 Tax=Ataeniobius toweri TaxID=208326 RepID=A0ABU7APM0_9TELE|nr:Phosphatidylinositol 4-phosphate 3-kinase C2 domain-containing subunit beta [Ataeniobius toweri]